MPLAEMKQQSKSSFLSVLGFSLLPCLAIASYRLVHWTTPPGSFTDFDSSLNFLEIGAQALMMLVLMVLERRLRYEEHTVAVLIVGSTIAQVLGSLLILIPGYSMGGLAVNFASDAGIVLRGFGSAVQLLGLGRYLCSVEPKKSALYIAAGYTIFGFVTLFLSFASYDVIAFASVVFPLITCLCLLWSNEKVKFGFEKGDRVDCGVLRKLPLDLIFLLFLCALTSIVVGVFVPPNMTEGPDAYAVLWPIIYSLVFVAYGVWVFFLKHKSVSELWPFLMLIIFSGLLCYSSFSMMNADFAAGFLRATQKILILFCWVFLTTIIFQYRLPSVLFFGLGNFFFIQLPSLLSFLGRAFLPDFNTKQTVMVDTAAIAFVGFALIVAVVLVLMNRKTTTAPLQQETSDRDDSKAIGIIVRRYGLTVREEEIASYAVRGYTFAQIAKTLFISVDTVRTHSKNLYKKMGIHKKQELIQIVEKAAKDAFSGETGDA